MKFLSKFPSRINFFWVALDLVTAVVIGKVAMQFAKRLMNKQTQEEAQYHQDAQDLILSQESVDKIVYYSQMVYLFNPYTLLAGVAKTTSIFNNLSLSLFLYFMMKKQLIPATFFLALATYKSLYPVMLIVPLCVILSEDKPHLLTKTSIKTTIVFSAFLAMLLYISYFIMGQSWSFLNSTYGFILSVPELTPNMSLFWYFFTEMFEHFRLFFVCTFQVNVFIYVIPMTFKLKKDPFLLSFGLIGLIAIFKSYPSYGDVGFYISLLPMLKHLFPYTKQLFIVACMFLASTVLGPILYHLWIYNGSANANYFFAINLVFGTAQIFLVTDILVAYLKREFYLRNGYKELRASQEKPDGKRLVWQ